MSTGLVQGSLYKAFRDKNHIFQSVFEPEMIKKISCALESNQQLLFKLITLGQQDGSIRHDMNGQDVALHMLCLIQGMRVVAKTGKYQAEKMQHVVDLALIQMKV